MAFESFAQRQSRQRKNGTPEIYIYDEAPPQLRHQLGLAFTEGMGSYRLVDPQGFDEYVPDHETSFECWKEIDRACQKEVFPYLDYTHQENFMDRVLDAIRSIIDMEEFLSVVEICCYVMETLVNDPQLNHTENDAAAAALAEVNHRFEQHGIGYQYVNGLIIRIDSQFLHAEVVKPALVLLDVPAFAKANGEFMTAHKHYRTSNFKDAVTAANRAFETMLKLICDLEGWTYGGGSRASELVTVVNNNGLFTHDFEKGITAYAAAMKTGLPSVRNDAGGHGEGLADKAVTPEIARYAINLTATNLIFLGNCHAALVK